MSTDTVLWIGGISAEALLVAILLWKRAFRHFPIFSLYVALGVATDSAMMALSRLHPDRFFRALVIETIADSVLQFGVLIELGWSVLRPIRDSLPRRSILVIALFITLAAAAVWPITSRLGAPGLPAEWHLLWRVDQTFSILRVLFFLGLAASSQLLAIGLRDRELQVATGLGLYSLVSLAAAVLHTHPSSNVFYHHVDQVAEVSYFCSLLYWVFCFVQKEAPRQEFSPRMQSLLLSVAGAARANRLAVEEIHKARRP